MPGIWFLHFPVAKMQNFVLVYRTWLEISLKRSPNEYNMFDECDNVDVANRNPQLPVRKLLCRWDTLKKIIYDFIKAKREQLKLSCFLT